MTHAVNIDANPTRWGLSPKLACGFPLEEIFRPQTPAGGPREFGRVLFVGESGEFAVGLWAAGPGRIEIPFYPVDELCTLLEGEVKLTPSDGNAGVVHQPGDSFFVPRGFSGVWEMPRETRKLFAAHGSKDLMLLMMGSLKPRSFA